MWAKQKGFTIVELLVVIVVIGILATIVIVAFNGVQNKSHDSAIQSDLSAISKKIQEFHVTYDRMPKGSTDLISMDIKVTKSSYGNHMPSGGSFYNLVYCWPNAAAPSTFAVVAASKSGSVYESLNGSVKKAAYAFSGGSAGICQNAGVTMDNTSYRDWFYSADVWQSYAK